jgi:hypothetical protein
MSDDNGDTLTKPKKERSDAQKAAYEKMVAARAAKMSEKPAPPPKEIKMTPVEKKLRLQAIKEQLAGKSAEPVSEDESEEEVEVVAPPKKVKKEKQREKVDEPLKPPKQKKEPKVIYQSASEDSESEEEVIIVKKKKKNKKPKKTIVYEESSSEEEEPAKPVRKERETKTQQNSASKFKVTQSVAEKPKSIYYFAE